MTRNRWFFVVTNLQSNGLGPKGNGVGQKEENMNNIFKAPFYEADGAAAGAGEPTAGNGAATGSQDPGASTGVSATDEGNGSKDTAPKSFEEMLALNPDYQKEIDRRVNQAVETATTKERERQQIIQDRFQDEVLRVSKMTQEEKEAYLKQKAEKEAAEREADLVRRELTLDARSVLQDKHLPESFLELLVYTDKEACLKSIDTLETAFNVAVQAGVEEKLKGGKPPKDSATEGAQTAAQPNARQQALEQMRGYAGVSK